VNEDPWVEVHGVGMRKSEAARLTNAQRADYAALEVATDESVRADLRTQSATQERARAAVAENGAEPILWVRRFSHGYVFVGRGSANMPPGFEAGHLDRLRTRSAERVPFVVRAFAEVILTEGREAGTDWPPRATCSQHGTATFADPRPLLDEARAGGRWGHPAKMRVHPDAQ